VRASPLALEMPRSGALREAPPASSRELSNFQGMKAPEDRSFTAEYSSDDEPAGHGHPGAALPALRKMLSSKVALMLVCVPLAWILWAFVEVSPSVTFVVNVGAIIPLSWLISEATEQLEVDVGATLGTLLNSSFGNVVEIILSISAIRAGLVKVVQAALLGSILMNLLLVLGCCFFVAGIKSHEVKFNTQSATYQLCLLAVSSLALCVPTSLAVFDDWSTAEERLLLSRGVAVLLMSMYLQWLVFNLSTHHDLFAPAHSPLNVDKLETKHALCRGSPSEVTTTDLEGLMDSDISDAEEDGAHMPPWLSTAILLGATVAVSFHCDWLVEAIDPVTKEFGVKRAFIATVLLPMVGNFSEEIAAVTIASKGKLNLAMGVAIGAATQVALLVVPIAVLLGWAMGADLDLDFEVFQVQLLVVSILVVGFCLQDGHANWLKGSMLMTTYVIISTAFWFIHDREFVSGGIPPPRGR